MRAALEVEALKLWRSGAARLAAVVVALVVPAVAAGFVAVALSDGEGLMAAKVRPMLVGTGWVAYLGMVAQLESVAVLLAVGIVVAWSFGREHTDRTFGSLLALPTAPRDVALAKAAVVVAGALGACAAAVLVALPVGALVGLGVPDVAALTQAARVGLVGLLTIALALPVAWVASARRGYLPGIVALLAVVVLTQLVTLSGAGARFPYAAPGIWSGMGGPAMAADVGPVQLLLPLPVGALGVWATARWWARAEVV